MKKTTNKLSTNLGHNNPPENIKSIEFTSSPLLVHLQPLPLRLLAYADLSY
jgi:hypothetical protein